MLTPAAVRMLHFSGGQVARAIIPAPGTSAQDAVDALALGPYRALVVAIGGASGMSNAELQRMQTVLAGELMVCARQRIIAVVDGGTDMGVARLVGLGAARNGLGAPLIGFCPIGAVDLPGQRPARGAALEPHHSHFVLAPGDAFGDETEMTYAIVDLLADRVPSAALLANGGPLTIQEALQNIDRRRSIIVCKGTGRAADAVAAAWEGFPTDNPLVSEIARRGHIRLFDVASGTQTLAALLQEALWG